MSRIEVKGEGGGKELERTDRSESVPTQIKTLKILIEKHTSRNINVNKGTPTYTMIPKIIYS